MIVALTLWACLSVQAPTSSAPTCMNFIAENVTFESIEACEAVARRIPYLETDQGVWNVHSHECKKLTEA